MVKYYYCKECYPDEDEPIGTLYLSEESLLLQHEGCKSIGTVFVKTTFIHDGDILITCSECGTIIEQFKYIEYLRQNKQKCSFTIYHVGGKNDG